MSIDLNWREVHAVGFPPPVHPAEPDLFCRQEVMPGHDQQRLQQAHVVVVGCGGLGSWIAVALARIGVSHLTLIDPDTFDRTNAPRQLMFAEDIGRSKAEALARNIYAHMTMRGTVRAVTTGCQDALAAIETSTNAVVVGVDNNAARLEASRWALARRTPAVFVMLSGDGLRAQVFRQDADGPCLSCVLPNLDPEVAAPCAAASIASCFLAAGHAVQLVADAVMGASNAPTWRETSLNGTTERASSPRPRVGCTACS